MLQNVEYLTLPAIKMLKFDSISELQIFFKFQQKAKILDIPESNLTPCKLSILSENAYEI